MAYQHIGCQKESLLLAKMKKFSLVFLLPIGAKMDGIIRNYCATPTDLLLYFKSFPPSFQSNGIWIIMTHPDAYSPEESKMKEELIKICQKDKIPLFICRGAELPNGWERISPQAEDTRIKEYLDTAANYMLQKNYQQAISNFEKALEIEPDSARANSGIGNTYAAMQEYQKAIPYLEKAVRIDQDDDTAYFGLGACYLDLQEHEKAIPYLKRAIEIKPDNKKASEALAIAFVRSTVDRGKSQQNQKAKDYIQSAIEIYQKIGNEYRANELRAMLKEMPD